MVGAFAFQRQQLELHRSQHFVPLEETSGKVSILKVSGILLLMESIIYFFISSHIYWGFVSSTDVLQGATPCVLNVGPRGIEPGNFR